MTRAATLFIWLTLVVGVPQILIGIWSFAGGGWVVPFRVGLIAFPFLPLILRFLPRLQEKLPPGAALTIATVSMAVSIVFYGLIISFVWALP